MGMALNTAPHTAASRIETIGWGLLLLMTGVLALIPGVPDGTWLVGLGVLMLGLNATRPLIGLPPDRFGVIVGSGALVAGIGVIAGIDLPVFAPLLILCGLAIIARAVRAGEGRGHDLDERSVSSRPATFILPDLGRRGEGWVVLQVVLLVAVVVAGLLGPAWSGVGSRDRGHRRSGVHYLRHRPRHHRHPRRCAGSSRPYPRPVPGGRLIENGPFGLVRHPMYGGGVIAALGWGLVMCVTDGPRGCLRPRRLLRSQVAPRGGVAKRAVRRRTRPTGGARAG